MTPILCTLFDSHYLAKGMALLRSLQEQHADFRLYVLACDETTLMRVLAERDPRITLLTLDQLEDADLRRVKKTRTVTEYFWTLTPLLLAALFNTFDIPHLAYIDADCYLFAPLDPLYAEARTAPIAIIPHRFAPDLAWRADKNGTYNVSWVYFANLPQAKRVLTEWSEQCLRWCYQRSEHDAFGNVLFGDQGYLDTWPDQHDAHIIKNIGANLAPWNQAAYQYAFDRWLYVVQTRSGVLLPTEPIERIDRLVFYHFHEHQSKGGLFARGGYALRPEVLRHIYMPYETRLRTELAALANS